MSDQLLDCGEAVSLLVIALEYESEDLNGTFVYDNEAKQFQYKTTEFIEQVAPRDLRRTAEIADELTARLHRGLGL